MSPDTWESGKELLNPSLGGGGRDGLEHLAGRLP